MSSEREAWDAKTVELVDELLARIDRALATRTPENGEDGA